MVLGPDQKLFSAVSEGDCMRMRIFRWDGAVVNSQSFEPIGHQCGDMNSRVRCFAVDQMAFGV